MRLPVIARPPSPETGPTAHERFRDGDRSRLRLSIAVSAAVHLLLALGWPAASLSVREGAPPAGASALELVALGSADVAGAGLTAVSVVPEEDGEEDAPGEEGDEEGRDEPSGGAEGASAGGDGRAEALQRIASVTPGVLARRSEPVEPLPVDAEEGEAPVGEGPEVGSRDDEDEVRVPAASSDLEERLTDDELLNLERLSSLQPELASASLSHWLVVRNPTEVRKFLRRRFPHESGADRRGTLSVSLWIDESGSVEWAEINRSSGSPDLDESALELFEDVIAFGPARDRGSRSPTAAIFWLQW